MSLICMIPARLGSKRVPKKNLRYLGPKPLICYVIESAIQSKKFDAIYINSDGVIFKEIADRYGIDFYLRESRFADDEANNDEFARDFLQNVKCDRLVQLLPTSPFIKADTITRFVNLMIQSDSRTCVSVARHQIASLIDQRPLNFSYDESHIRSQDMKPVFTYATVLMGWQSDYFLQAMEKFGFAYHGQENNVDFFEVEGLETIDIDNESDFELAEAVLPYFQINDSKSQNARYFESGNELDN